MSSVKLIGVAGLPGSGKSTFFARPDFAKFFRCDNIGTNWRTNEEKVCQQLKNGKSAIVSDIEFCNAQKRDKFEMRMGRQVEWVFFENAPWKCALNCLFRYYVKKQNRPLHTEIRKIKRLSQVYHPPSDKLAVKTKDVGTPKWKCAISCLHRFYCLDDGVEGAEFYGSLRPDLRLIKEQNPGSFIDLDR
jgi:hypothetical protein